MLDFITNNPLFVFIPLLFAVLLFSKPFRNLILYCVKNIVSLIFFMLLSFFCSAFGVNISVNIFSIAAVLLLGLPGCFLFQLLLII